MNIFTPLSTIAGPSNPIFALDNDTGNLFWTRRFEGPLARGHGRVPRRDLRSADANGEPRDCRLPEPGRGGGRGRGSYSSAVGEPGAGVPLPAAAAAGRGAARAGSAAARRRAAPAPARRAQPPAAGSASRPPGQCRPSPFPTNAAAQGSAAGLFRPSGVVHAVSADGMFRTLGFVSGKDVQRPAPFLPAGARFSDLIAVGDMVYTATSRDAVARRRHLGDQHRGRPEARRVVEDQRRRPIGSVVFATNGTAIAAIGPGTVTAGGYANAIVALDPKTLALKDWFTQPGVEFAAPPVLFQEAAGTSWPRRRRTDASCCSTPARSAARITTRRCSPPRRSLAARHLRGAITSDVAGARTGPRRSRAAPAASSAPPAEAHAGC